jgi:hypothetical protein
LIVTEVPTGPLVGLIAVIAGTGGGGGGAVTWNVLALLAVLTGVVTVTEPVVEPDGTVVVIIESLMSVKVAGVPLNLTAVAPVRPLPVMVTAVPGGPLLGESPDTIGWTGTATVNGVGDEAVPPAPVTVTAPVVAPVGTCAVIELPFAATANVGSEMPPKATDVAPVKPLPLMVTVAPTGAAVGATEVTAGVGAIPPTV